MPLHMLQGLTKCNFISHFYNHTCNAGVMYLFKRAFSDYDTDVFIYVVPALLMDTMLFLYIIPSVYMLICTLACLLLCMSFFLLTLRPCSPHVQLVCFGVGGSTPWLCGRPALYIRPHYVQLDCIVNGVRSTC